VKENGLRKEIFDQERGRLICKHRGGKNSAAGEGKIDAALRGPKWQHPEGNRLEGNSNH